MNLRVSNEHPRIIKTICFEIIRNGHAAEESLGARWRREAYTSGCAMDAHVFSYAEFVIYLCVGCVPFKHIQVDAPWTPKSFVGKTPQELVEEVYTCISKYVAYFCGQVSPAAC